MAQDDLVVTNGTGAAVRAKINAALNAIATSHSGTGRPSTILAGQCWIDTNTPSATVWTVNYYDGSDDVPVGLIDTVNNTFLHLASDGTAAAPGMAFTLDPDTGIYRIGANALGVATGGTLRLRVDANGLTADAVNGAMVATQAQMEAASAANLIVAPGLLKHHPAVPKAWCRFTFTGPSSATVIGSTGVVGVSRVSQAVYDVALDYSFSSTNYGCFATCSSPGVKVGVAQAVPQSAAVVRVTCFDLTGALDDFTNIYVEAKGDLP